MKDADGKEVSLGEKYKYDCLLPYDSSHCDDVITLVILV